MELLAHCLDFTPPRQLFCDWVNEFDHPLIVQRDYAIVNTIQNCVEPLPAFPKFCFQLMPKQGRFNCCVDLFLIKGFKYITKWTC